MNETTSNAWQPALASFALPGLGQFRNGEQRHGLTVFSTLVVGNALLAWLLTSVPEGLRWLMFGALLIGNLVVYVYAIGQAYLSKNRTGSQPWHTLLMLWMLGTALVMGSVFLERSYWIHAFKIPSESMEPAISAGDYLMTTKRVDQVHPLEENDVVVFMNPNNPSIYYIKRIVALPGDTVQNNGNILIVNGKPAGEYYGDKFQMSVPHGEVFVIGDNRKNTSSSVNFGTVPIHNIVAKPILRWASSKGGVGTTDF